MHRHEGGGNHDCRRENSSRVAERTRLILRTGAVYGLPDKIDEQKNKDLEWFGPP
jgi:hypothetical protein